jgi:hypothetical protein
MIAVAVREHAEFKIFMLAIHIFDRIHDDVGVGIREPGIDQNQPIVAGNEKRLNDAARPFHSARNNFNAVDGKVFENTDHKSSFTR